MTQSKKQPAVSPYDFPELAGELVFAALKAQTDMLRAVCVSGVGFLGTVYLRQSGVESLLRPLRGASILGLVPFFLIAAATAGSGVRSCAESSCPYVSFQNPLAL